MHNYCEIHVRMFLVSFVLTASLLCVIRHVEKEKLSDEFTDKYSSNIHIHYLTTYYMCSGLCANCNKNVLVFGETRCYIL